MTAAHAVVLSGLPLRPCAPNPAPGEGERRLWPPIAQLADGSSWEEIPCPWPPPLKRAGVTVCRCGAVSEVLHSNADRRRWHKAHKDAIRAEQAS